MRQLRIGDSKHTSRLLACLLILAATVPWYAAPAEASNLLQGGGSSFESFYQYATDPGSGTPLTVGLGWHPFAESGTVYFMSTRQFNDSIWGCQCWVDVHDGEDSQIVFTPGGPQAFTAGLYQRVSGVAIGTAYALSGRIASAGDAVRVGRKVGIDPYGGTDPTSPNIVWGDESWATATSHYQNKYAAAVAQASTITVFIRITHPGGGVANSDSFIDAFVLDPAPRVHTNALPAISQQTSFTVGWGLDWKPPETEFRMEPGGEWYEVQVRDGAGAWANWQTKTQGSAAGYAGQDCHTYAFRTRAVVMHEVLSNVGSRLPSYWPPDGHTRTTVLTAPPTSAVSALPAYHRTSATVTWSGSPGSCGITGYDVQVRDGLAGAWTAWLTETTATSAAFAGQDGHTYYFRSAARGSGGYVEPYPASHDAATTFDATPPVASVGTLPQVTTAASFPVSWSATDSGSGVASFDVQTRSLRLADDADSGWQPWLSGTAASSATFAALDGRRYWFRVTARDALGNLSAPAEAATNVLVTPAPVLATSAKAAIPAFPRPGGDLTYVITLANTGNLAATVNLSDGVPVGYGALLTETIAASAGAPVLDDGGVEWEGSIGAGSRVSITFTIRLSDTLPLGTYITNHAVISDGTHGPFTRTVVTLVGYWALLPEVLRQ